MDPSSSVPRSRRRRARLQQTRRACFAGGCAAWLAATAGAQSTERASVAADGSEIPQLSRSGPFHAVSDDGRFVVFVSAADDIAPFDTNGADDVFLRDRLEGKTILVSHAPLGRSGNRASTAPAITPDGAFVVFSSWASNLVSPDGNNSEDVFVWERATGTVTRASNSLDGVTPGDGGSAHPTISADGRLVAFASFAGDLVDDDTNGEKDAFVHDRATGVTRRINLHESGREPDFYTYLSFPAISRDGSTVVFVTDANLVSFDFNDINVYAVDLATGMPEMVDVALDGWRGHAGPLEPAHVSANGRFVAFVHPDDSLAPGDQNGTNDVFLRDRLLRTTEIVSLDADGRQDDSYNVPYAGPVSDDGRFVAFRGESRHYADVATGTSIVVRDRALGVSFVASRGDDDALASDAGVRASMSGDGRFVVFWSGDRDLVPGDANQAEDVFIRERDLTLASWERYGAGAPGRFGEPGIGLDSAPSLTRNVALQLGNSLGGWTVATVVYGFESASLPIYGGELLVAPFTATSLVLPPGGGELLHPIPGDEFLVGERFFIQALELDPFAVGGVSLTAGIEAVTGY